MPCELRDHPMYLTNCNLSLKLHTLCHYASKSSSKWSFLVRSNFEKCHTERVSLLMKCFVDLHAVGACLSLFQREFGIGLGISTGPKRNENPCWRKSPSFLFLPYTTQFICRNNKTIYYDIYFRVACLYTNRVRTK